MTKRTFEVEDSHLKFIGSILGIIGICFSAFFYLNDLHVDETELELAQLKERLAIQEAVNANILQEIRYSESTRYAEIMKYYNDESKTRGLSDAEQARVNLVEKQLERIERQLDAE